jgi:Carboxypeptidase regulatory-like domain
MSERAMTFGGTTPLCTVSRNALKYPTMLSKSFMLSFVGSLIVTFSAGGSILEGVVKDPTGRPVKGADVRIEARNFSKIVKTDANGHYVCDGLGVATYKATLVINGQVKASIPNATTQASKPTQLNFSLTGQTASAKKHTHMVYMRPDIDTHIGGGGQWVEVDDNGKIVNSNGTNNGATSNVTTVTGTAVQQMKINVKAGGSN